MYYIVFQRKVPVIEWGRDRNGVDLKRSRESSWKIFWELLKSHVCTEEGESTSQQQLEQGHSEG